MIVLKTGRELALMKEACRISAGALKLIGGAVEPLVRMSMRTSSSLTVVLKSIYVSRVLYPTLKGIRVILQRPAYQ